MWKKGGLLLSFVAMAALLSLTCCGTDHKVPETNDPKLLKVEKGKFPHKIFDKVLKAYNRGGFVDYEALGKDRKELDRYLAVLGKVSPKSSPELFPDDKHKLAYWINAYNALIFQNVLSRYPFKSLDGKLFQTQFFYQDEFTLGGGKYDLYNLENKTIRPTFKEPRIHFALNCASFSCPRLPEEAFTPQNLEQQLQRETLKFMNEERNVSLKASKGRLVVSMIFNWYNDDFVEHSSVKGKGSKDQRLIAYINQFRSKDRKIPANKEWEIEYRDYDWTLNDRKPNKKTN